MRILPVVASYRYCSLLAAIFLLSACGGGGGSGGNPTPAPPVNVPGFVSEGLDGLVVTEIREHNGRLYAATHDGLFGKAKGDNNWVSLGLDGFRVESLAIIDDMRWVAAVFDPLWDGLLNARLMETYNGGGNWSELVSNWGGTNPNPEPAYSLLFDDSAQRLYASGANLLAKSDDLGTSWELLEGQWASGVVPYRALALNAANQQLWYGGQNSIEELILNRYDLNSGSSETWLRLLPSPAVAIDVELDPTNADHILVASEGGLLQSMDNGQTWETPLGDVGHRFYFDVALDPQDPATLYTIGWDKNFDSPQPLILEVSYDSGTTWQQHEHEDETLFGGAWSLHATVEDGATVLYAGLFRGGIYKISF